MSWSINAIGKVAPVCTEITRQAEGLICYEPEETIRLAAKDLILKALESQDDAAIVRVNAYGSQSYRDWAKKEGVSNTLNIQVEPIYGFVE